MKLRTTPFYDGDFTRPFQVGPMVPVVDPVTQSGLYRITYWQRASLWRAKVLSSRGPHGSYLVEEGEPNIVGGDVFEWTRLYALIPRSRSEPEQFSYGYQFSVDGDIAEVAASVPSRVLHEYFHTLKPENIPLAAAFRVFKVGSTISYFGTPPASGAATMLGEDQICERWRGNIYCRITRTVPTRIPAA